MLKTINLKFSKKTINWLGIIFIAMIIGVSLQIARAWTEPTDTPPNGNVSGPLNVGNTAQYKSGALGIGGVFGTVTDTHLAVLNGEVGIGTTTPQEKLVLDGGNFLLDTPLFKETGVIVDGGGAHELDGARSVYVSGKYAYIASWKAGSLSIIDISNPSSPIEVGIIKDNDFGGTATELWGAYSVYVSGKYAYVAAGPNGHSLSIIDISNPSSPTETGVITDESKGGTAAQLEGASSVYVSGKYAYVASQIDDSLSVFDISEPSSPTETGVIMDDDSGGTATELIGARSVYISGKYAYVASLLGSLSIFDISDPSSPTETGVITDESIGGTAAQLEGASSVYVSGKYAYVASYGDDSLSVFDISDPSSPTEIGVIVDDDSGGTATQLSGAYSVYVSGKYAYVASSVDDSLSVFDISDPSNPTEVSVIVDTARATELNEAESVYISGKYAYVVSGGDNSLSIFDISGIDAPAASIGSISASTIEATENVDIGNNFYIRNGANVGPGGIKSDGPIQASNLETLGIIKMTATTTVEICDASTNVGSIYYDDILNKPCYCDAVAWTQFDGGGTCP